MPRVGGRGALRRPAVIEPLFSTMSRQRIGTVVAELRTDDLVERVVGTALRASAVTQLLGEAQRAGRNPATDEF